MCSTMPVWQSITHTASPPHVATVCDVAPGCPVLRDWPSKNIFCKVPHCSSPPPGLDDILKLSVPPKFCIHPHSPQPVASPTPPESLFCWFLVASALVLLAHQGYTLLPGWLEGAGPELGLQVLRAVVLAVALQEVQRLQLQGRLWGKKGVTAALTLTPSRTLPATLLAYLAAIRGHRTAFHMGQRGGAYPLLGREVEWDVIWPFQGHWAGL